MEIVVKEMKRREFLGAAIVGRFSAGWNETGANKGQSVPYWIIRCDCWE